MHHLSARPPAGPSSCLGVAMLTLVLLLAAFIPFALAAFGVGGRINLLAAGLACWVLAELIPAVGDI